MTPPHEPQPSVPDPEAARTAQRRTSAHEDPTGEAPWAMQIVVHVPAQAQLDHESVCEAVATAVVALLDRPEARPGGDWHPAVSRWLNGRIRKVVRRARAGRWDSVQAVPGITVEHADVQVRSMIPGPTDHVPEAVRRLQVSGLELPARAPAPPEPPSNPTEATIWLNPHLALTTGKAAAQCGHAAQLAAAVMSPSDAAAWSESGHPLTVKAASPEQWSELAACADHAQTRAVAVHDAGFTEIPAGSLTVIATW